MARLHRQQPASKGLANLGTNGLVTEAVRVIVTQSSRVQYPRWAVAADFGRHLTVLRGAVVISGGLVEPRPPAAWRWFATERLHKSTPANGRALKLDEVDFRVISFRRNFPW
jgi:hypothetical protein